MTHESSGFRDRGIAGSLSFDPRPDSDRGLSLTLSQTMGAQAQGGMDALLGQRHLGALAANDEVDEGNELERRALELKLGYGIGMFADRYTATPEAGLGLTDGHRQYSLGGRLGLAQRGLLSMELGLTATQREAANDSGSGSGAGERAYTLGWRFGYEPRGPVQMGLEFTATRREAANDGSAELMLRGTLRW